MKEHDGCLECRHFDKSGKVSYEDVCYECEGAHTHKTLPDKFEPMTNADRIRKMTDEELAEFISAYATCEYGCYVGDCSETRNGCAKEHLKWLQEESEVEND